MRSASSSERVGPVLALAAWLVFLCLAQVALYRLGRGGCAPPPLDFGELHAWLAARSPADVVLALVRLLAVALGGWLLLTTVVSLVLRLAGMMRTAAVVETVTLGLVRALVGAALGYLAVGSAAITGAAGAPPPPVIRTAAAAHPGAASPLPLIRRPLAPVKAGEIGGPTVVARPPAAPEPSSTSQLQGSGAIAAGARPGTHPLGARRRPVPRPIDLHSRPSRRAPLPPSPPASTPQPVPADMAHMAAPTHHPGPAPMDTWTVHPGDSFWSIATVVLESRGGPASDADIDRYWQRLVSANADRLVDGDLPDLIYPGQVFVLPPPSPPS